MNNLLQAASFEQHCPVCAGAYLITLYDILQQQRIRDEWQSARPPHQQHPPIVDAIPAAELAELEQAWEKIAKVIDSKSLDVRIAVAQQPEHTHVHSHPVD